MKHLTRSSILAIAGFLLVISTHHGHLVAECEFPDAYGYAIIGDPNLRTLASGYVAKRI